MRQNNVAEMTIHEQIEKVAEDMCLHYCKYPDIWDEEKEGCSLDESEVCQNCPLMRL